MENRRPNLRVPGPTPVPPDVAAAGSWPMVNHRGPEFAASMAEIGPALASFFGTSQLPLILTGSGTGALEAAIVNVLSPGDEVLSLTTGVFGDRFAAIAEAFGAHVRRLETRWGAAVRSEEVREALERHPGVRALLVTHNETSTGVTNDVAAIAGVVSQWGSEAPLVLVDGVSSIGAVPFEMDAWGVDVAITGSQKAWMTPPGLAMVAVSDRAWARHREARMPRYYWDFTKARTNAEKGTMPFTPAVSVIHALRVALRRMTDEGPEAVFFRHRRIGERIRAGVSSLGLELFADPAVASNTVTAVRAPDGVDASAFLRVLRERYGVVLASGQDRLKGEIFRIGHLGWVDDEDVDHLLEALGRALEESRTEKTAERAAIRG